MRACAIALLFVGGCGWFGALPYRFESPAQSGARILNDDQLEADAIERRARLPRASGGPRPASRSGGLIDPYGGVADPGSPRSPAGAVIAPYTGNAIDPRSASGVVISRLPDPRSSVPGASSIVPRSGDGLRDLVGTRRTDEPLAFAVAMASAIAERPAPPIALVAAPGPVTTPDQTTPGETLVRWLESRAAGIDPSVIRAGDLLVFDRAVGDRPASLVAVALGRDDRGVIEMIYLAAGIVRRGFVDPVRTNVARDRATRRVHNTYLRHGRDWPPSGTRFLAGQLLKSAYRLP